MSRHRRAIGWILIALAGGAFYIIFEAWWKGLLLFLGTVIIDIGVDMAILEEVEREDRG